jgi:hypothetical protein
MPAYGHMDVLTANRDNAAIPLLRDWLDQLKNHAIVTRRARS